MRLSGFLPVIDRRVVVALGVAGMLMVALPAAAQTTPPAQEAAAQPEPPDPFKFDGLNPVMVLLSIRQGQETAFEEGFTAMRQGLAAAEKPEFQAQAASIVLLKVSAEPGPGQPYLYVMYLNPPVANLSYDFTQIFYYGGAFDVSTAEKRKAVDDIYAKFVASLETRNLWPMVKK